MYPELFEIPLVHLMVKSYGLMMVIGFLLAVSLIRHLSRSFTPDPQLITNAALYSLIGGVVGARAHFVVHYWDQFQSRPMSVFAIWHGGLELLGGVILAITIIVFYLCYHKFILRRYKLPIRRYLDVLAVGLMLALVPGRIGCFLNGCCFGKPSHLPWAVRFPYDSLAYHSQINADPQRNRPEPWLKLPREEYLSYVDKDEKWYPIPYQELTEQQKQTLKANNQHRSLPVHPTQLYSSAVGAVLCLILYLFRRRARNSERIGSPNKLFAKPGQTFALMFILYGVTRFYMEFLRDDNPFEYGSWIMYVIYTIYKGGTISQNIGIYLVISGVILMAVFQKAKSTTLKS